MPEESDEDSEWGDCSCYGEFCDCTFIEECICDEYSDEEMDSEDEERDDGECRCEERAHGHCIAVHSIECECECHAE